jgi:hypothetical protein
MKGQLCCIFKYFIQICFICLSSGPTVSEDAGIEPRTAATLAFVAYLLRKKYKFAGFC